MREIPQQLGFCRCCRPSHLRRWVEASYDCQSPKQTLCKPNERRRRRSLVTLRCRIGGWITFMIAVCGTMQLANADFGETLSILELLPAPDSRYVVQTLTSSGDRHTLWASAATVNATGTEIPSIILFNLFLTTDGILSKRLNYTITNRAAFLTLYYDNRSSLVSYSLEVNQNVGFRDYSYDATSMKIVAADLRTLCAESEQKIRIIPKYVSEGYSNGVVVWQVVVCPSSLGRLQCTDISGRTSSNMTSYALVGNGTLLLAVFAIGPDSLVCTHSIDTVNGKNDATGAAKVKLLGETIVSTAVFDQTSTKTVIFMATSSGSISRWYLSINKARDQYFMYALDGFRVPGSGARGTSISFVDNTLIVPVQNTLFVIDTLDSCDFSNGTQVSCSSCVTWKSKFCGWCYSTSRCTAYANCPMGWIPASPSFTPSCPGAGALTPSSAAVGSNVTVTMKLNHTIQPNSMCSFSVIGVPPFISVPILGDDDSSLKCAVPSATYFLREGSFNVMFSVFDSGDSNVIFGAADFTYVDCSVQSSCTSCLQAHTDCIWCKNEQKCIYSPTKMCPSGNASTVTSYDQKCPRIVSIGPKTLPCSRALQVINISVLYFPEVSASTYECRISGLEPNKSIKAVQTESNQITCEADLCNYLSSQFQADIAVTLWRNNSLMNVNMGNTPENITLYKCSVLKSCYDCNRKQTALGLGCVWCPSSGCSYRECSNRSDTIVRKCLSPNIDKSKLELSSYVGGSNFTLVGWGLGDGIMDRVRDSVRINGSVCSAIAYVKRSDRSDMSDSITCKVPSVFSRGNATISVNFENTTWSDSFYYYDPEITDIDEPKHCLVSGGVSSRFRGYDLDRIQTQEFAFFMKSPQSDQIDMEQYVRLLNDSSMSCSMPSVASSAFGNYTFGLTRYGSNQTLFQVVFIYYPDPEVFTVQPSELKGTSRGGQRFSINGSGFTGAVADPLLRLTPISATDGKRSELQFYSVCNVTNQTTILCTVPSTAAELSSNSLPVTFRASLEMDNVRRKIPSDVTIHPDPVLFNFTKPKQFGDTVVLDGQHLTKVYTKDDYSVFVDDVRCQVREPAADTLVFIPPTLDRLINVSVSSERIFNIKVVVDGFIFYPGALSYTNSTSKPSPPSDQNPLIIGISCGGVLVIAIILIATFVYRRKAKYHETQYKRSMQQLNQMEFNVRAECKQAFAELQADMTNLTNDMVVTGIPYWDYGNFTYKILFPGTGNNQSLSRLTTKSKGSTVLAMNKFELLVCSRSFLSMFIHTLEEQETFSVTDRVNVASLVMLILQNKMDYATLVMKDLLSHLIRAKVKKTNAKLLLRSSESVVERMLTHWLSLCLYKYIQDFAGMPLFVLYKAIKQQIEKGPVDAIAQEARYSLSEERLLREKIDSHPRMLRVVQDFSSELLPCRVLDCDSISQVKEKILDAMYRNTAYSLRPSALDYLLVWRPSLTEIPLEDEDSTSEVAAGWKKLNTLSHYLVPDEAVVQLCLKSASLGTHSSKKSRGGSDMYLLPLSSHVTTTERHSTVNKWHLSKHRQQTLPKEKQQETMVSEIFLTRLVKTKGTLQEFIDKLFATIFSCDRLPPVIKFLFDFLDDEYKACGINDPEVLHIWKNNSLHLRFWINLIKNPDFVFDVSKSAVVDSCLTVVAQTLIDSCSTTESDYGTDAPVNKLLFAKDRPRYRRMVEKFYADIRNQPAITEQELNIYLNTISSMYPKDFYRSSALQELYHYAKKYLPQLMAKLDEEGGERNHQVKMSLLHINEILDSVHHHGGYGPSKSGDSGLYSFV